MGLYTWLMMRKTKDNLVVIAASVRGSCSGLSGISYGLHFSAVSWHEPCPVSHIPYPYPLLDAPRAHHNLYHVPSVPCRLRRVRFQQCNCHVPCARYPITCTVTFHAPRDTSRRALLSARPHEYRDHRLYILRHTSRVSHASRLLPVFGVPCFPLDVVAYLFGFVICFCDMLSIHHASTRHLF